MFEDALMESGVRIRTNSAWLSLFTFLFNLGVVAVLAVWPLSHPQALPKESMDAMLIAPAPPPRSVPVVKASAAPSANLQTDPQITTRIPRVANYAQDDASSSQDMVATIGSNVLGKGSSIDVLQGVIGSSGTLAVPVVPAIAPHKLTISSGVMAGNKIAGSLPPYPPIAKAAHVEGTVVLQALVSKKGRVENVRVLSGPAMLQSAAAESVRGWRYKPYLLDGEPIEVETTISVVFRLGG
jgi:periplasmic protein TonB